LRRQEWSNSKELQRSFARMTESESASRLAKATLIALRAAIGAATSTPRDIVTFFPDMIPLSSSAAEAHLRSLPKPMMCVSMLVNSHVYIGTWTVATPDNFARDVSAMLREGFPDWGRPGDAGLPEVLVRSEQGETDAQELTCLEYEQWMQDYQIPLASIVVDRSQPMDAMRSTFVVLVGPPSDGWMRSFD
jgi:hypothetical protein